MELGRRIHSCVEAAGLCLRCHSASVPLLGPASACSCQALSWAQEEEEEEQEEEEEEEEEGQKGRRRRRQRPGRLTPFPSKQLRSSIREHPALQGTGSTAPSPSLPARGQDQRAASRSTRFPWHPSPALCTVPTFPHTAWKALEQTVTEMLDPE